MIVANHRNTDDTEGSEMNLQSVIWLFSVYSVNPVSSVVNFTGQWSKPCP